MPARIVIVHNDPSFREPLLASLKADGHNVVAFVNSSAAWGALEAPLLAEVLVTRIDFGPGKPHGIALARSAQFKRPEIKVLFVARPQFRKDAEGIGLFLPLPVTVAEVAEAVGKLLA